MNTKRLIEAAQFVASIVPSDMVLLSPLGVDVSGRSTGMAARAKPKKSKGKSK